MPKCLLDINLLGTFFVVQHALARMVPRGEGTIVCVASDAGIRGGGGLIAAAAYAASKAGVQSLVKSIAREMSGKGIRINALNPGPSDTPLHRGISQERYGHPPIPGQPLDGSRHQQRYPGQQNQGANASADQRGGIVIQTGAP